MHSDIVITAFAEPSTTMAVIWRFLINASVYTTLIGFKCERDYKERLEMQDTDEGAGLNGHLKIF